jgi:YVTN family beta-propeller protein
MYPVTAIVNVGNHPSGAAVDPITHTVYVTNYDDGTVSVIDESTHDVVTTVELGHSPASVAVNPGNTTVYVAGREVVPVINGSSNKYIYDIPVGETASLRDVAVNTDTGTVYIAGSKLDADNKEIGTLDVTGSTSFVSVPVTSSSVEAVAVDPGTQTVYATNYRDGTVSVIKVDTSASSPTYKETELVEVGKNPDTVEVDPVTHAVYVTDNGGKSVSVIDGSTHKVTDTIAVGNNPDGVAVDPDTHTNLFNRGQVIAVCSHDCRAPIRDRSPHTCRP